MRFPKRRSGRATRGAGLPGGRFSIILVALIGLAVYWFSNQKEVPFTGRTQFNTMSIEDSVRLGAQSYAKILQQEGGNVVCARGASGCGVNERELVQTVRDIGARLERAAVALERHYLEQGYDFTPVADKFDWTYNVVASEQSNAFCLPGGYVAVYTGILDITGNGDGTVDMRDINDVDKLAVVMGHEIAHALAHHGAERMSQQKLARMGQMAVGLGLGDMSAGQQQAVMQAFGMAAQGGILAFSREHETEADKIGLDLLARACFDPREAPQLWQRMGEIGGERPPEFMSTHPASETRAENFRRWMPEAIAAYEAHCETPLR